MAEVLYIQTHLPAAYLSMEEGVRKGGVSSVYPSDNEGVLFTHEFVGALLALASKDALGEMVAAETLISIAV